MRQTIELNSWSDFENIIKEKLLTETQETISGPFFYRGHSDAIWRLETTLERSIGSNQDVDVYYGAIKSIQSDIETFTDRSWDLPNSEDYFNKLRDPDSVNSPYDFLTPPIRDYMQYLRHFGYPSPLLDWTYSPFIAAYFAFRDVANKAKSVAVYEYFAVDLGPTPFSRIEGEIIYPIYSSSGKNKRHYLQQSVYTVCLHRIGNRICYANHEFPPLVQGDLGPPITKYILPASERTIALHSLEAYNINAYSLMGTEESLLESLFLRAYKDRLIAKNTQFDWEESDPW